MNTLVDNSFLDWFAGFVDGEGSFVINRHIQSGGRHKNPCVSFYPKFQLALRDDDKPILITIQKTLGIGTVLKLREKNQYIYNGSFLNSEGQSQFRVSKMADSLILIEILQYHPLRSKKIKDFNTWSLIVQEKYRAYSDGKSANRILLSYLFEKLKFERKYGNKDFPPFTDSYKPSDIDYELISKDHRYGLKEGSRRWLQQKKIEDRVLDLSGRAELSDKETEELVSLQEKML